ncbi:hypothetical protein ACFY15_16480 [Streptomyces sp. NPDC001373]|uniref:hypothetical protein n=1 Tax=Streptomyces sp. NPDC001373 TaxID=3364565 RepID=UPI0036751998
MSGPLPASSQGPPGPDGQGDVLGVYLEALAARCGRTGFEAVVAAARDTCAMLAEGHPAVLAGPDGEAFGPALQREYLALLAVLMTGRCDLEVIAVPTAGGRPGWAVVEPGVAADPASAAEVRARVAAGEADRVYALGLLEALHDGD